MNYGLSPSHSPDWEGFSGFFCIEDVVKDVEKMDVKLSGTFPCQEAVESKFLKLCSERSLELSNIASAVAGWRKQTGLYRFRQFT